MILINLHCDFSVRSPSKQIFGCVPSLGFQFQRTHLHLSFSKSEKCPLKILTVGGKLDKFVESFPLRVLNRSFRIDTKGHSTCNEKLKSQSALVV